MQDLLILLTSTLILVVTTAVVLLLHASPSKPAALHTRVGSALARWLRQPAIVIRDRATAHRLLVRGSAGGAFSDRPPSMAPSAVLSHRRFHNLTSAPYGPFWRVTRRNLTSEVLHPLRLSRYAAARREALRGLVSDLGRHQCDASGGPMGLVLAAESIRAAMFGLLVAMCFGAGVDPGLVRAMADAQHDLVQFFPELRVFARLPGVARLIHRQRWGKLVALRRRQEEMYLPLIHARRGRQQPGAGDEPPAYVDTLIDLRVPDDNYNNNGNRRNNNAITQKRVRQRKLTDGEMVGMCSEFLGAGTETVAAALQWTMANLVKRPQFQDSVRREIDAAVDADAEEVGEEVLPKLEYLNAVVMEVLRLYPTATLVLRQVSKEDNIVHNGRRVPAGTNVLFPLESLAKDETAWDEPREFRPERFLLAREGGGESVSLEAAAGCGGETMKMMPFGAGRRVCPGMGMAVLHMGYFVANLVREFEWKEAEGEMAVDLRPHFGFFTVMKRPLRARLVPCHVRGGSSPKEGVN